jgi:catechol 2,3-dioxygenase-like lactoylglutathione lyase family enzyme
MRLVEFYEGLGFRETFRTPEDGVPIHVEVSLDGFTIGIADADSAQADHGCGRASTADRSRSCLDRRRDRDYARLTAEGAPSLSPPHDWLEPPPAWVADPDGNPIQLAQRRQ